MWIVVHVARYAKLLVVIISMCRDAHVIEMHDC